MTKWTAIAGVVTLGLVFACAPLTYGQLPPAPPQVIIQRPYIPVTVAIDLKAVTKKVLQELDAVEAPPNQAPPPRILPGKGKLFNGKLLKKIRERKPLQKLLAVADELQIAQHLQKIAEPVSLGDHLWLSPNIREVAWHGVHVDAGAKRVAVFLAVRTEPTITLSKIKPPPMPLPKISLDSVLPPPAAGGTPFDVVVKIDPKAIPAVLPDDAKKELDKYGIDVAKVTFAEQREKNERKLLVTVPITKPLEASLKVCFTPEIKDNVLSFKNGSCTVETPPSAKQDENSVKQTLQLFAQKTIVSLVTAKLATTTVDFKPHFKKIEQPPTGNAAPKVRADITGLRVASLSADRNYLVARITGKVAKNGIVIFAP